MRSFLESVVVLAVSMFAVGWVVTDFGFAIYGVIRFVGG